VHLSILLDMAADALPDRVATSDAHGELSFGELRDGARAVAARLARQPDERTVFLGVNSLAVPLTLFATALAGTAFTPLNFRLSDPELRRVAERAAPAVAVVDDDMVHRLEGVEGLHIIPRSELMAIAERGGGDDLVTIPDPDAVAVLLFTSGTTGEPKAAVLRHAHLSSYVFSTLDFASSDESEAALVSVPPYHIAGISAAVTSLYTGRRVVYLEHFTAEGWVDSVEAQHVTHAMVVPTMLGRVLDVVEERGVGLASLHHVSYGGGRMPVEVIQRALDLLPQVDFVNAYGLTETSSTISVLGPDDHREALTSDDPTVRARLGSVGRPHGAIEVSVRDQDGSVVAAGGSGEIWVRGPQVSGEYVGKASRAVDGWFPTNDGGRLDDAGYLYVEGRLDDVIVRGGENISPGEIEDVLRTHPAVDDVAVVGVPSQEWGELIAAAVVVRPGHHVEAAVLQEWVRERLRSTKVPATFAFLGELPYNETGKLLRRVLRAELTPGQPASAEPVTGRQ
jgi:fatty-acyl-CoA synthase